MTGSGLTSVGVSHGGDVCWRGRCIVRSFSDLSLSCPGQPVRDRMTAHYSVPVPTDTQVTFQGLWQSSRPRGEPSTQQLLSAPQLEKEERIHSVDIGNDGSAFVEVLVGSSAGGATAGEQDYEVSRVGTPRISIINPHLSSRQLWLPERGFEPPSCLPESPGRAEGTERAWGVSLIIRGDGLPALWSSKEQEALTCCKVQLQLRAWPRTWGSTLS